MMRGIHKIIFFFLKDNFLFFIGIQLEREREKESSPKKKDPATFI